MAKPVDSLDELAAAQNRGSVNPPTLGYAGPHRLPAGPSQQGMAIAGFVLSFIFSPLGLVFSWIALSGMKANHNDEGKGLAIAGLVLSLVGTILCLFAFGIPCCLSMGR